MKTNFYLRSKFLLLLLINFVFLNASAQTISSNSPVCQEKNLLLTASGGVNYSWVGPNGFTSTLRNPQISSVSLARAGVYTLTVVDANSITSTATTSVIVNPTPIAVTTTSNIVCEGQSVGLVANNANTAISNGLLYTWSGPSSFTANVQNPVLSNVTMARGGLYIVTISTIQGCTAIATSNLSVNPKPVPPLVTNYTTCAEEPSFTLAAFPSNANMQLLWYGTNAIGGVGSTTSPTVAPVTAGTTIYYVSQKVNTTGCESARSEILVLVNPKPIPPIVTNKTYSQGSIATSLTAMGPPGLKLFWYGMNSSGGIGSTLAPIPSTTTLGVFDFYVSQKDSTTACESNRSKLTVTVVPAPPAPQISSDKIKLCNNESAFLTAAGCAGTITWSNGLTGIAIVVNSAGTYYAFCTVGGGQSPNSDNLVITALTTNPPTINSSNGQLCLNATITLTASVCQDGTILWNNGATGTSIQISTAGTYAAQCQNPCGISPNSNILTISQSGGVPTAPAIISNKTVLCNGEAATLTAVGCAGSLIWNNGMTPTSIQIAQSGTYTAICRNQCGDSNSSNPIVIRASITPAAPVAISNKNTLCNGESATLTVTACNGTIQWNNGMTSSTIQVSLAGFYSAVCQNICGNSLSSNSIVINSSATPNAPAISSDKTILCDGERAILTASGCAGTVLWSNGVTTNSVQLSVAGTYSATCVNVCGVSLASNPIIIRTNNRPTAPIVIASNLVICGQGTATLTASNCNGNILWNDGHTTNQIVVNTSGTYSAQCQNVCGQSIASNFITISRNNANCIEISICSGANLVLTNSTVGLQYSWAGPNGFTSTLQNPQISNVSQSDAGVYTSTVIDANNNTVTATTTVIVNPTAVPPTTQNIIACAGASPITLSATANAGNEILWYQSSTGGIGSTITPIHDVSVIGTRIYYVSQRKPSTGCESQRAELVVTINAKPLPPVGNNIALCQGDAAITLSATALPNHTLYWNNSSTTIPTLNPIFAGSFTYNVSQRENTANGCISDPAPIVIVVKPKPTIWITANSPLNVGQTLQFGSTVPSGTSYLWSGPNGFSSTIQNPKISSVDITNSGTYTLAGNLNGCLATATIQVMVVAPNIKIYDDALKANWVVYTTHTNKNLVNTNPVQSGTKSISVRHTKSTGNIEFVRYNAQSLTGITHLKFWIHGGTTGSQKISVMLNNISTKYNVVATKNVWTLVSIPLTYFGSPSSLNEIYFMNNATTSQPTYYLDNIYLAGSVNARFDTSNLAELANEEDVFIENREVVEIENVDFNIYPNPVIEEHSTLNLSLKGFEKEALLKVELLDNQGIKQKEYILHSIEKQNSIEIPKLDSGIYMIRITDGKKVALKRLIVNR